MDARDDLDAKLAGASEWVREEFSFLAGLADDLGCAVRAESGPGLALRVRGAVIARAHPKRKHIGVGLPEWMRPDIQALTGALRDQHGFAWFNYTPLVADRDTVELLLTVSRDSAESLPPAIATPTPSQAHPLGRSSPRPTRDDGADLTLVLAILEAFRHHAESTGLASAIKPIREAIFFQWEGPRLPPGGKYSFHLPHSPAARAQRTAGSHDGLVYEHVAPIAQVIRALLRQLPGDTAELRTQLEATADRVIITKAEDALLTATGMRDSAPDALDPWSRYRRIGLGRDDFRPVTDL